MMSNDSAASFWLKALIVVFVVNAATLAVFTFTVNGKLEAAIELGKPQQGSLTLISATACPLCGDFASQKKAITSQNVDILEEKTLTSADADGAAFIEKYGIQKLPALVFETRERVKVPLQQAFKENGRMVGDTAFVWEQSAPPYVDLATGETKGLVGAIFLVDGSCGECSDAVQAYKPILTRFGVALTAEETVDIGEDEGKALLSTYSIESVPTVILSPEAAAYASLASSWKQVGSVEADGTYIFRKPSLLRMTYRDLKSGEVQSANTGK